MNVFDRLVSLFTKENARFRIIEHAPEGRSDLVAGVRGTTIAQGAKAIVCATPVQDGREQYVLAVLPGDRRVDMKSVAKTVGGPVTFPPGWLSRSTRPLATGSPALAKTIGIVRVSRWAATVAGRPPVTRMMSGCKPTNSCASARIRLMSVPPHRTSIRMLRPSVQPKADGRVLKSPNWPRPRAHGSSICPGERDLPPPVFRSAAIIAIRFRPAAPCSSSHLTQCRGPTTATWPSPQPPREPSST
jgi:hypothetical protein